MKPMQDKASRSILKPRFARGMFPLVAALLACALAAPEARAGDLHTLIDPATLSVVANTTSGNGDRKAIYAVNGAGMNADGTHQSDVANGKMWEAGGVSSTSPGSFKVDLGRVVKLSGIKIWNYNWKGYTNRGAKDMEIYYTASSEIANASSQSPIEYIRSNWTQLKDSFELPQAPGDATYAGADMITFDDVTAQWVVFVITSQWGGGNGGLSEVRFYEHIVKPVLGEVSFARTGAATYSLSATEDVNTADLSYILSDGETVTTNGTTSVAEGGTATWSIAGLTANKTYQVSVVAENSSGMDEKTVGIFYAGELSLGATTDADENGPVSGTVAVSRAASSSFPLTLNYTISSSAAGAAEGTTWAAPAAVAIPAGETTGYLLVTPLVDASVTEDVTVTVTLSSGNYEIPASASATLDIANLTVPSGYNTWIATSDGLASVGSNWSTGIAPTASDNVLFDGRYSTANCEWDAAATAMVASWTMQNGYTGIVTLDTVYPGKGDFICLTVTGAMTVDCGTITHPQSRTQWQGADDYLQDLLDNETYRIRIDAGSLTVGANGRIDARNKGYYHANTGNLICPLPSHGGRMSPSGQAPYDDVKEPIHIGMAYKRDSGAYTIGIGGGAVYLTSEGAIVVDGYVGADTGSDTWGRGYTLRGGAAAGSVYIRGASVTGTGTISASALSTSEQNNRGVGGRVAVISTSSTPVDYTTLHLQTTVYPFNNNNGQSTTYGSCGTVFVKDATQTYGTLLLQNVDGSFSPTIARCTPVTAEGDWTFDAIGLGNRAVLSVPVGTELHLQGGLDSVFSLNAAGSTAYGSIRYEGGTLDFGSAANQTMAGNWMLTGWTNLTLNANVVVKGGAAIGVPAMADILDDDTPGENAKLPDFVSCNLTVTGNLTVESDGFLLAKQCGLKKYKNSLNSGFRGVLPGHTHGGRCLSYKGIDAQLRFYTGYDSVFAPCLPGNSVPWPNGQAAEASGGVIRLVVAGALTLNGEANANGMLEVYKDGGNCSGGTGGSIDITAGTISGTGRVVAEAGSKQAVRGSAGRIAVKLTSPGADFSSFSGTISASGRVRGSGGPADSSAGTVYLQTAADGEKGGTVIIAMSEGNRAANNTNTTEMVSLGYGGDAIADYRKVKYVVRDYGRAAVNANMKVASIEIADANSSLDLEGHTLTVNSAKVNGVKLASGTYTVESTVAIGEGSLRDYLVDTATGGALVVTGGGFSLIVR